VNGEWQQVIGFVKGVISKQLMEIIHNIKLCAVSDSKRKAQKAIEGLIRAYFGEEIEIGFR
jgi:hypothetical protein